MISEPDDLLIELIADATEKLCGYKPDNSVVEHFISSNIAGGQVSTEVRIAKEPIRKTTITKLGSYIGKSVTAFIFQNTRYEVRYWIEVLSQICKMDYSDIGGYNEDFPEESKDIIDTNSILPGQLIKIYETQPEESWKYTPLFFEGIGNLLKVWQIGYNHITNQINIIDGILIDSKGQYGTEIIPTNLDKSKDQIRKIYVNKYDEGYSPGNNAQNELIKPMLPKKYSPPSEENTKSVIKKFPVSVMKNVDGERALARLTGKTVTIRSKLNDIFPNLNHLKEELKIFLRYLPNCELDGTLYLTNTENIKKILIHPKNPKHTQIVYYISDIIDPDRLVWEDRYKMLVEGYTKYISDNQNTTSFSIIQCYNAHTHDQINDYRTQFIQEGATALLIRRYGCVEKDQKLAQYRPNKTNSLAIY